MKVFLDDGAHRPSKETIMAAGFDLHARIPAEEDPIIIPVGGRMFFDLGVHVALPFGTCALVVNRSGLARKRAVETVTGLIDSDYRGSIGVTLKNGGNEPFIVHDGDRISQMVLLGTPQDETIDLVGSVRDLGDTERGNGGFGSTGV